MQQIIFEFPTQYGVFRDALYLPADHGLTDEEIQAMKQSRLDTWLAVVEGRYEQSPLFVGFVQSDLALTKELFERAGIGAQDTVFDLGCGDGLALLEAAKLGAKCVGIEFDLDLIEAAKAALSGFDAEVRREDIRGTDLTGATCVYMYVNTPANEELLAKLKELPIGTKVITQDFAFDGLKEAAKIPSGDRIGYIYEVA